MARPSIGAHCSGALSLTDRSGVRQAVAAPRSSCSTERSARPPLSMETALAAAGTARAKSVRSATKAERLRATSPSSPSSAPSPLGLEEELGLVLVDQQANLLGEELVVPQPRVAIDDVEGDLSRAPYPLAVPPQ